LVPTRLALLAALLAARALAQEGPRYFELLLPDFSDHAYPGGPTTIEHPPRPLERLTIQLLNPYADTISYGNIFVTVNGKGLGNVLERRANDKGKILVMTPASLRTRPDELFDARENAVEVRAVDPRGRAFYQNWVLRASEPGRNEFFSYATTISRDDPQGVPPDLILTEPAAPVVLKPGQSSVRIAVKGTLAAKDAGASISLNGQPWLPAAASASKDFNEQVAVSPSTKSLVFEAVDKKGNRRSVTIPVFAQQAAAPKPKFAANRYAVVIGISRFINRKGAPSAISGAATDADELAKQLQAKGGFPAQNVRVLLDDKATLDQVKIALGDFAAKAKGDDLVVVYVATHGLHDPLHPEKLYLAAYDTQIDSIDTTALGLDDLESLMDMRVRANNVLLLFDAGHKLDSEYKFPSKNLINNRLLNLFNSQEGRAVMVSSSSDEVSTQRSAGGALSSLFAYWLAEGLSGKADVNYDNVVTADELFKFVAENVRKESSDKQTPRYRVGGRADLPLVAAK